MARKQSRKTGVEDETDDVVGKARGKQKASSAVKARRSWKLWILWNTIKLGFWATAAIGCVIAYTWFTLDQKGQFKIPERAPGIRLLAADGSVLAEKGAFDGDAVIIDTLPEYVAQAVMSIEDRRFHEHYGIDPRGILRAVVRNVMSGRSEGGSTLTQQLAKNLFLSPERTMQRKLQEAVLAVWLENKFTKDEIMQLYLNRVYFGGTGIGLEKASQYYFQKSAVELNLMEAAILAGVLKAPTTYNPARNPEAAAKRAKLVIDAMVEEGYVSAEEAASAVAVPTSVGANDYIPAKQYAVDWIVEQLPDLIKKKYDQSIIIETTIDPRIQADAEASIRNRLADNGKKLRVAQGAMVVMDTRGAVKAMVGGRSYKKSQFNRATKAKRQPGSAFKPFVFLQAFERGLQPDDMEQDEPVRIGNWQPENYRRKYLGPVSLERAFALSLNSVAAKLAVDVGPGNIANIAQRFGITSPMSSDASIALGTSEVTLFELTSSFVPFANGGTLYEPHVVRRISTRDGEVLYERRSSKLGRVIGSRELGMMNRLFRSVVRNGTAKNASIGPQDVGGKTGTSQDYRDAWFVGFSPYLISGVWLGNDDNTPTKNVTGGSLPAVIWRDVMAKAHRNYEVASLPGDGTSVAIKQQDYEVGFEPEPAEIVVERKRERKQRTLLDLIFSSTQEDGGTGLY
jgi:penicillin-binding protein 1A